MKTGRHILLQNLRLLDSKAVGHRWRAWRSYRSNHRRLEALIWDVKQKAPARQVICIAKTLHMGDIIACEPVARQVRKDHPDAFIVWCLQKNYADLMRHHPAVDHVLAIECLSEWLLFTNSPWFDRVIDLEMDGKACNDCKITLHKPDNRGVTFDNYLRMGTLLEAYLRCADYQAEDKYPQIFVPAEVCRRVAGWLNHAEGFVVVHCSSNEKCKDWTLDKWQALLTWLSAQWPVQIIEVGTRPALAGLNLPRYQSFCGRASILETAELIRRSALFIGVESGPAHLANAVGVNGIVLVGKYASFVNYLPYNGNFADPNCVSMIYSTEATEKIEVETVKQAVESRLSKRLAGAGMKPVGPSSS